MARARDLGLIFIPKSVVEAKFPPEAPNPLATGQWVLLTVRETGEKSQPELGIYWWRATSLTERLTANLFPNVERIRDTLTIHQVHRYCTLVWGGSAGACIFEKAQK